MDKSRSRSLDFNVPFVASGFCNDWPSLSWTHTKLEEILGEKIFTCRVSEITCEKTLETECVHFEISMMDFNNWLEGKSKHSSPLQNFPLDKYCCYIDYKYMKDMFMDKPEIFHQVMWNTMGLSDFDGSDSTIWIGSKGANTPCHQDTYGFNLVTQIQGKKLWILFPPEDAQFLYPSRIPYEESSIFSYVNVRSPDLSAFPLFKKSHPVIVVLNPGETLYVPRHWWHFVQSLEPSISVNVWVPTVGDKKSRYHEAITRTLASGLIKDFTNPDKDEEDGFDRWLNPTEALTNASTNMEFLKTSLSQFLEDKKCSQVSEATIFVTTECESVKLPHLTEMKSEDTDYLHNLSSAMENYPVYQASSPFDLNNLKRKSSVDASAASSLKKLRPSFDRKCEDNLGCRKHEMLGGNTEDIVEGEREDSSQRLFMCDYCPIEIYLKYMKDICYKSNCSCSSQRLQGNESNSVTTSGSHKTQIDHLNLCFNSQNQTKEPTCSSGSVASSNSHANQQELLSRKHNLPSNNSVLDMAWSKQSKDADLNYVKLSRRDIAEAFLRSILHPDIVQAVSAKLEEQCEILLNSKDRKTP